MWWISKDREINAISSKINHIPSAVACAFEVDGCVAGAAAGEAPSSLRVLSHKITSSTRSAARRLFSLLEFGNKPIRACLEGGRLIDRGGGRGRIGGVEQEIKCRRYLKAYQRMHYLWNKQSTTWIEERRVASKQL